MTCLTDRERRVIELASHGRTVKETAHLMHRSEHMVRIYRARAYQKLGATSDAHAVQRLYEHDRAKRRASRARRRPPQMDTLGL